MARAELGINEIERGLTKCATAMIGISKQMPIAIRNQTKRVGYRGLPLTVV